MSASSSKHKSHYVLETAFGTTPDTPAWTGIRHTGLNPGLSKTAILSNEIRDDRQIKCLHHGNRQVGGEIAGELVPLDYDEFLKAVLCSVEWAARAAPVVASTISAAASDNSINDSASGLPLVIPGDKITLSGFTGTVGNNQSGIVVSRTAAKIVLVTTTPLVDDAAGEAVTVTTNTLAIRPGSTRRSYSILRNFTDLLEAAKPFHIIPGVEFNTLSLTFGLDANVLVSFAILGRDYETAGTAPDGSTYTAAGVICPFTSHTGTLRENGTAISIVTEGSLTLENGLAPRFVMFSDMMNEPMIGRSNLSGSITAYFENATLLDKFLNETASTLEFVVEVGGWRYSFFMPNVKYNGGQPDVSEQADIMLTLPFQALYDTTYGTNLVIAKTAI